MPRPRIILLACSVAALAALAFTGPAMAANPKLALVNGIPGKTVDVCIGTTEVRSGLRFGKWVERSVAPGSKTIRFRLASGGRCQGKVLAQRTLTLEVDADLTVVGTSDDPKVVVFTNNPLISQFASTTVRHAADFGRLTIARILGQVIQPNAAPTFAKGEDSFVGVSGADGINVIYTIWRPGRPDPVLSTPHYQIEPGTRHEVIIVGSSPTNARVVAFGRPQILP